MGVREYLRDAQEYRRYNTYLWDRTIDGIAQELIGFDERRTRLINGSFNEQGYLDAKIQSSISYAANGVFLFLTSLRKSNYANYESLSPKMKTLVEAVQKEHSEKTFSAAYMPFIHAAIDRANEILGYRKFVHRRGEKAEPFRGSSQGGGGTVETTRRPRSSPVSPPGAPLKKPSSRRTNTRYEEELALKEAIRRSKYDTQPSFQARGGDSYEEDLALKEAIRRSKVGARPNLQGGGGANYEEQGSSDVHFPPNRSLGLGVTDEEYNNATFIIDMLKDTDVDDMDTQMQIELNDAYNIKMKSDGLNEDERERKVILMSIIESSGRMSRCVV